MTYGRCDEEDVDARWRPMVLSIHLHCDLFAVHCAASVIVVLMSTQSSRILSNHFFLSRPTGRMPWTLPCKRTYGYLSGPILDTCPKYLNRRCCNTAVISFFISTSFFTSISRIRSRLVMPRFFEALPSRRLSISVYVPPLLSMFHCCTIKQTAPWTGTVLLWYLLWSPLTLVSSKFLTTPDAIPILLATFLSHEESADITWCIWISRRRDISCDARVGRWATVTFAALFALWQLRIVHVCQQFTCAQTLGFKPALSTARPKIKRQKNNQKWKTVEQSKMRGTRAKKPWLYRSYANRLTAAGCSSLRQRLHDSRLTSTYWSAGATDSCGASGAVDEPWHGVQQ